MSEVSVPGPLWFSIRKTAYGRNCECARRLCAWVPVYAYSQSVCYLPGLRVSTPEVSDVFVPGFLFLRN